MRQHRALKRLAIDKIHGLAGEEVKTVHIFGIVLDRPLDRRLCKLHDRLEQNVRALLHKLTERMQIGGEDRGRREQTLAVLALALAEQLLPPFGHHRILRLIADHHFHRSALAQQNVAGSSIFIAIVFVEIGVAQLLARGGSALHQCVDVAARDRDRQKSHSGQHREASADVVRHNEGLIALSVGKRFQRAACAVGGHIDVLLRFFASHGLFKIFAEHAESDRRLGGGAGLGNDIHGDTLALAQLQKLGKRRAADGVTGKIDIRRILFLRVIQRRFQKLDRRTGAEIRAADADGNENISVLFDAGGSRLDAGKLFPIIVHRKIHPAQKIVAETAAAVQHPVCRFDLRCDRRIFLIRDKSARVTRLQFYRHVHSSIQTDFAFSCTISINHNATSINGQLLQMHATNFHVPALSYHIFPRSAMPKEEFYVKKA